jgi:alcohol dehydrogenase
MNEGTINRYLFQQYFSKEARKKMQLKDKARELLEGFKGENYSFGKNKLEDVASYAAGIGDTPLLIGNKGHLKPVIETIMEHLKHKGIRPAGGQVIPGSKPNSPRDDVYRLASYLYQYKPDSIVAIGGGSTLDAAKAANVLYSLGDESLEIEDYFGTGKVTEGMKRSGKNLLPMIAVQTNASSGSHLTKYSNVTDLSTGQKKLIVDDAVIPDRAVFDYGTTTGVPLQISLDGAMDGISHCLEVFYGAKGEQLDKVREVALTGIELIIEAAPELIKDPANEEMRELLGLGTDLGGYSIMLGGTNGGHLTSFSLVDATSHGRACGIMNPYYTVFFAPAIQEQLYAVGDILKRHGYMKDNLETLSGRRLAEAVAEGLMRFAGKIGFPTTLSELEGFSERHINRALAAAKNPQLKMKLENMPVSLTPEQIDEYMGSVLEAARKGNISLIRNI